MRVCRKCSSENSVMTNFCQACGAWLENGPANISHGEYATPPSRDAMHPETGNHEPALSSGRSAYQCSKCGSSKGILNRPVGNSGGSSDGLTTLSFFEFAISIDANPNAMAYKNRMTVRLFADICGECGHAEFKVEYPRELYRHYLQSNSK
jgi:hypothetical protein